MPMSLSSFARTTNSDPVFLTAFRRASGGGHREGFNRYAPCPLLAIAPTDRSLDLADSERSLSQSVAITSDGGVGRKEGHHGSAKRS